LFLSGFETAGGESFVKAAGFFKSLTLRGDLAFQHVQSSAYDEQHGVDDPWDRRILHSRHGDRA
jgi:hypothetical protein